MLGEASTPASAPGVGARGEGCVEAGILNAKIMVVERPPTDPGRDVWALGVEVGADQGAVADSVGKGLEVENAWRRPAQSMRWSTGDVSV